MHQSPVQPEMKSGTARTETVPVVNDNGNDKEESDINSSLQPHGNNLI